MVVPDETNAEGTNVRRLTDSPGEDFNAVWQPLPVQESDEAQPIPTAPPVSIFLTQSPQRFPGQYTVQVGLGDLDADGDLDAVFANMQSSHSQVWLNDGSGQFVDSGQELTQQGHGVGIGDLDGDGDLDLFVPCASYGEGSIEYHKPSKVYLNNGSGTFQDSGQDLGDTALSGTSVTLIDIDTDDDLDACVSYYEHPYKVYLNDGTGTFAESDLSFPPESELGWADLDGDGDLDVFIKDAGEGYTVMLNNGGVQGGTPGDYVEHWQQEDPNVTWGDVGLGDLDADGDPDAVVASGDRHSSSPTFVFLNDGTGRFVDSGQELSRTRFAGIELADLDDDGDLDAFITNFQRPDEVWLNDGAGRFYDSGLRLSGSNPSNGGGFGDLDSDGDLDIFVATFGNASNVIWLNDG
jgi:hypothetical protein